MTLKTVKSLSSKRVQMWNLWTKQTISKQGNPTKDNIGASNVLGIELANEK